LLGSGCLAVPRPSAQALPQECGQALNADLGAWNLDSALARTNRCIKLHHDRLAEFDKAEAEKKEALKDSVLQAKMALARLLCVKTQVLTLKGDLAQAQETLKYAELFNRAYPETGMSLAVNNSMLPITRAFLLEKSGDLKGAAAAYKDIAAATKAAGFISYPDLVCGRLAVIFFDSGDEQTAARWSRQTASFDSGAKAMQGALLQKQGDAPGARDKYEETLKLLAAAAKSDDVVLPLYFAEQQRVKDGLAEVVAIIYK
jgi:tetratricopeptide (TPR) repeat protein